MKSLLSFNDEEEEEGLEQEDDKVIGGKRKFIGKNPHVNT
jgi:hypothetical protein